ncbi:hypothetical protein STEG23_030275 [Scotinomys teguina]
MFCSLPVEEDVSSGGPYGEPSLLRSPDLSTVRTVLVSSPGQRPTLKLTINGVGIIGLLDTGADRSIIAKKIGLVVGLCKLRLRLFKGWDMLKPQISMQLSFHGRMKKDTPVSCNPEKNNDIMKFAGKWMELENVILSEDQQDPVWVPEHLVRRIPEDHKAEDVASMDDVESAEPTVVDDIGPAMPPNGDRA